jgi:CarD family transcriptional regulator
MHGGISMYEIGEYIVKPMNGVCKVEDITCVDMPGADKNKIYYLLIPI